MPLVSIIVPVYNAEKTIGRCVSSILNQKYGDFELILLDDGSTDSSGKICDEFAKQDSRITVTHKENTGVSDTRNLGIAMARGKYLQFADSDDWIAPESTELFTRAAAATDCDMVISDFYRVVGNRVSQKGSIDENGIMERADYAVSMMRNPADFYFGVLWNKFYRRSIVEENHIMMDVSLNWCEDLIFNLEYIRRANRICAVKVPLYYYVKTKGSLASQGSNIKKTMQMKRRVFVSYNDFCKAVFDDKDYEKWKGKIYHFLFDVASDGNVSARGPQKAYRLGKERVSAQSAEPSRHRGSRAAKRITLTTRL